MSQHDRLSDSQHSNWCREGEVEVPALSEPFRAYLAVPDGPGSYPAVVLAPSVAGLARSVRELARRWAEEGFVTLALDLGDEAGDELLANVPGDRLPTPPEPRFADNARVLERIAAGRSFLASFDDVSGGAIAFMGYGPGAAYALQAARATASPAACVAWCAEAPELHAGNGGATIVAAPPTRLSCPHLIVLGEAQRAAVAYFRRLVEACEEPGRIVLTTYAGADSGFYDDSMAGRYRPQSASEAWTTAVTFLRQRLR